MSEQPTSSAPDYPFQLKEARHQHQKTPLWALLGCFGIVALAVTGVMIFIYATGQTLGLPIGGLFNINADMGVFSEKPAMKVSTLLSGSRHEYRFTGIEGTPVSVIVTFPFGDPKLINRAVAFKGPSGESLGSPSLITLANAPAVAIQTILPSNGRFTVVITGIKGVQGSYTLQAVAGKRN